MFKETLKNMILSENHLIWIDTKEYSRCERIINDISMEIKKDLFIWDVSNKIHDFDNTTCENCNPLDFIIEKENSILILKDFHKFINDEFRKVLNTIEYNNALIIISPVVNIPYEMESYISVLKMELPSFEDFSSILDDICEKEVISNSNITDICNNSKGLTQHEFINAVKLSLVENKTIDVNYIFQIKKQIVENNGNIKIYNSSKGFDTLIGMDKMKKFAKKMVLSGEGKGILIVGISGGGKTEFAKRLGYETNRLTISLDFGNLMGSYVGETEKNTKEVFNIIDSISPNIVFIDEIEKGLSGTSNDNDSVSKRQGGQFLKWMQNHNSDSYVVATANDIYNLPPEFLRSGRWDAIFFVDIPSNDSKTKILDYYKNYYNLKDDINIQNINYTGAEIETLCRLSKNLEITLQEAKEYVNPISVTMREQINNLRAYSKNRFVLAD